MSIAKGVGKTQTRIIVGLSLVLIAVFVFLYLIANEFFSITFTLGR